MVGSLGLLASCQAGPSATTPRGEKVAASTSVAPAASASVAPVASPGPSVAGSMAQRSGSLELPNEATLSAPTSSVLWVLMQSSFLFRSTDQGRTWEQRPGPPRLGNGGGGFPQISFVDERNGWILFPGVPETQCNGAGAEVWRTTDGGASWQQVSGVEYQNRSSGLGYSQQVGHRLHRCQPRFRRGVGP